jgi:CBS domain-containing protein
VKESTMPSKPVDKLLKEKRISDVINPRLIQAPPDISVTRALDFMRENQSAYIVVAENKKVVGMFTETDVIQKVLEGEGDAGWKKPIRDFMTKNPVVLRPDDTVGRAIDLMAEHSFYHIPLVNERQELTGVLSVRTLVRFLAEFYPAEVYNLPPDPHQVMKTAEGG